MCFGGATRWGALFPVRGYVRVSPKPAARLFLVTLPLFDRTRTIDIVPVCGRRVFVRHKEREDGLPL